MISITQYPNVITIDNFKDVRSLHIKYMGSFIANINENINVKMKDNKIVLIYEDIPQGQELMQYSGELFINKIYATNRDRKKTIVSKYTKDDRWGNLTWKWGTETSEYKNFNQLVNSTKHARTIVSYERDGKLRIKDRNNRIMLPSKLNSTEIKYINNKGNYGFK